MILISQCLLKNMKNDIYSKIEDKNKYLVETLHTTVLYT